MKKKIMLLSLVPLCLIFSSLFIKDIVVSNIPRTYLPKDLPSFVKLKSAEKVFDYDENFILMFKIPKENRDQFFKNLSELNSFVENQNETNEVNSIFNYEEISGSEDGLSINPILDKYEINFEEITKAKIKVEKDRFIKDVLVDKNFEFFSLIIRPKLILDGFEKFAYEGRVFEKINSLGLNQDLFAYGGDFAIDMEQFRENNNLGQTIIPFLIILGFILLYALYRSIWAIILSFTTNIIVTALSLALLVAMGYKYNLLASVIPTIILSLNTAFAVHLFSAFQAAQKKLGVKKAIRHAVEEIKLPSLYSAITTAIGMGSLSFSDIPPMRAVGIICGISVLLIYVLIIYYIPALVENFVKKPWPKVRENDVFHCVINFVISLVFKRTKLIISFVFICVLVLISQIFNVESETNIYNFFNDTHKVNIDKNNIKKHFAGVTTIDILFHDKSGQNLFLTPEFNQKIDKLKSKFIKKENIGRVFGATDIIKQFHWAFNAEREEYFSIPESKELIEQYLFVYDGEDLYDFLSRDYKTLKWTFNLKVDGSTEIDNIINDIEKDLGYIKFPEGISYEYTGYGKVFADQVNLVVADLYRSLYISLVLIFFVVLLLWKNLWLSALSMVPNMFPIAAMFGIMGMFGIYLDIGTAMIASVTLGIAIDDTIHIVTGIKKRVELGHTIEESIKETLRSSGRAVIVTTLILSSQFLILVLSDFTPLKYFGLLTFIGLFSALVLDLMLMPSIVKLWIKEKHIK